MNACLCHVFVFVEDRATALQLLRATGLSESFQRTHDGQGTANLCACFDNAYLELLWAEDEAALASVSVARTRLAERSRWRENGASPFGIGLRGRLPCPSWDYRPSYLPTGMSIPVALGSEDPRQPFLFRSPSTARPDEWTDGLAGARQSHLGLREIIGLHLDLPVGPSPAMRTLAEQGLLSLRPAVYPRMVLTFSGTAGGQRRLSLPDFTWVG